MGAIPRFMVCLYICNMHYLDFIVRKYDFSKYEESKEHWILYHLTKPDRKKGMV